MRPAPVVNGSLRMDTQALPGSASPPVAKVWKVVGILTGSLWIGAGLLVIPVLLLTLAMANDSGVMSDQQHLGFLGLCFAGHALVVLAGAPLGLTFFWRGRRKACVAGFAGLILLGIAIYFLASRLALS